MRELIDKRTETLTLIESGSTVERYSATTERLFQSLLMSIFVEPESGTAALRHSRQLALFVGTHRGHVIYGT